MVSLSASRGGSTQAVLVDVPLSKLWNILLRIVPVNSE